MSDFSIVLRSMRSRMFSTVTTCATVAVAVALMIVLVSMQSAGRAAFERGSGNMHLLVSKDASPLVSVLNGVFYANAPRAPIAWEQYEAIAGNFPFAWAIPTQLGDSYRDRPVLATTSGFFTEFEPVAGEPWEVAEGRLFERAFEVVVGSRAARETGLAVGDVIYVTHGMTSEAHVHHEYAFEVVGVVAATGSPHDRALFVDLMSSWILHAHDRRLAEADDVSNVPLTTAADVRDADRLITGIYARVITRPGMDASAVLQQVFDGLRRDTSITVASPSAQVRQLFAIVGDINLILVGMSVVVLVSSGVSIMLALYNSMEQRRRQVAIMRVLGCSRGRVFRLVVTESAMIGLIGGVAGAVLSIVGSWAVSGVMRARVGVRVEPSLALEWVLAIVLAAVYLSALAGVAPAMIGYRTSVARHLRPVG